MVAPGLSHVAGRLAGEVDLYEVELRKLNPVGIIEPLHTGLYSQGGQVGFLQGIVLSLF